MSFTSKYRVFISHLPWTIGPTELRNFASSFGKVLHSHVVFDKNTGMSKGYGFITFASKEGLDSITQVGGATHMLEGNFINCNPSTNLPNNPSGRSFNQEQE